jgi:hypothetical protein
MKKKQTALSPGIRAIPNSAPSRYGWRFSHAGVRYVSQGRGFRTEGEAVADLALEQARLRRRLAALADTSAPAAPIAMPLVQPPTPVTAETPAWYSDALLFCAENHPGEQVPSMETVMALEPHAAWAARHGAPTRGTVSEWLDAICGGVLPEAVVGDVLGFYAGRNTPPAAPKPAPAPPTPWVDIVPTPVAPVAPALPLPRRPPTDLAALAKIPCNTPKQVNFWRTVNFHADQGGQAGLGPALALSRQKLAPFRAGMYPPVWWKILYNALPGNDTWLPGPTELAEMLDSTPAEAAWCAVAKQHVADCGWSPAEEEPTLRAADAPMSMAEMVRQQRDAPECPVPEEW